MERHSRRKVLIVEAEPAARLGVATCLSDRAQWRVVAGVSSLTEARRMMPRAVPDVLLVDAAMEREAGYELVKEWGGRLCAVVFSAREEPEAVQKAWRAGARGYVSKRDALDDLVRTLEIAAGGGRHMSPRIANAFLARLSLGVAALEQGGQPLLSPREREVFRLYGAGLGTKAVASELGMSAKTVETHAAHIKEKLGLQSLRQVILEAGRVQLAAGDNSRIGRQA